MGAVEGSNWEVDESTRARTGNRVISFAELGPDTDGPRLALNAGWLKLSQHWLAGAGLMSPDHVPTAALTLRSDGILVFGAQMRPSPNERYQPGSPEFLSGLWQGNVVELFLGNPQTGRYLEMHLSPRFAWWSCLFSGVREREQPEGKPLPYSVVKHQTDKAHRLWQATVEVPAATICTALGVPAVTALTGNLTAIFYPQTGSPCYFSHANLLGPTPDFHQPPAWLPLYVEPS
jgi:hypothetical protein